MVELLAVLVVLGLIATIVSVNWRAILPATDLHSSVRELASTLEGTRSDAIARNAVFRVEYDLDQHRYRVSTPYKLGGGLATLATSDEERVALPWIGLPKSVRFHRVLIDGEEYTKGMVYVRFDPLGAVSTHSITLVQKPYDTYYTVEVQGLTGQISFHEGLFVREIPKESDFQ